MTEEPTVELEEAPQEEGALQVEERLRMRVYTLAAARARITNAAEDVKVQEEAAVALSLAKAHLADVKKEAADIETSIRGLAVTLFNFTGLKSFVDKLVGIRVTEDLEYDEGLALEWAAVNAPALILTHINKPAFEAYCKAVSQPEFVTTKTHVTATIVTKLPVPAEPAF